MSSFYELSTLDGRSQAFDFASLEGKVVLIVNVASLCGFSPQYDDLEILYQKYKSRGLEILAFPCNQFGGQEPDTSKDLESFIRAKFKCTFPIMKKTIVNGDDTNPVYQYLKSRKSGSLGFKGLRWNFEKFLVDRKGEVRHRFVSAVSPLQIESVIVSLLNDE
ncbi:hypothetical protein FT663_01667 [Candidozyma haemuli var. vulneris]|uniref:Glutathione peroxidase n=1 Tax=Candidozyma haemuli TaxID=45357 RepID=A0A2V1AQ75_9ASCO|nr:hypothetical protein CXQ85_001808 [[Candida] haemuloni]KAF3990592.1 hypothetical protein FT662_02153 [[Candida] haemuloni var. vulneris]KAF3993957.1 hypothetical protein FT663_01667 [[Candida] haemuloni var. vulneris]PVH20029.1 hypothetical protein CXQ85_001808 [[Candida] haemuloni]